MPNSEWFGVTGQTPGRIVVDAGALYRDWGLAGEQRIGATRGGSTFTVDREDREMEVDGGFGPIKGLRRVVRYTATIEATLVELSEQTLTDATRGTSVSDGTHLKITPDLDILDSDFYSNVALVGQVKGESDPIVIKLLNTLVANEFDITTGDEDEGETSLTFEAHYKPDDIETPPFEILLPVGAS